MILECIPLGEFWMKRHGPLRWQTPEATLKWFNCKCSLYRGCGYGFNIASHWDQTSLHRLYPVHCPFRLQDTLDIRGVPDLNCNATSEVGTAHCSETSLQWDHSCRILSGPGSKKAQRRIELFIHSFYLHNIWSECKGEETGFLRGSYIVLGYIREFLGWHLYSRRKLKAILSRIIL